MEPAIHITPVRDQNSPYYLSAFEGYYTYTEENDLIHWTRRYKDDSSGYLSATVNDSYEQDPFAENNSTASVVKEWHEPKTSDDYQRFCMAVQSDEWTEWHGAPRPDLETALFFNFIYNEPMDAPGAGATQDELDAYREYQYFVDISRNSSLKGTHDVYNDIPDDSNPSEPFNFAYHYRGKINIDFGFVV